MSVNFNPDKLSNDKLVASRALAANKTETQLRNEGASATQIKGLKHDGTIKCETCSSRKYVDGSDDPGVSFKTPQGMTPSQAAVGVASHEREHVTRNAAKAEREDKRVVASSVKLFSAICPECGNKYISGGETRTVTKNKIENFAFSDDFFNKNIAGKIPKELDEKV